MSSSSLGVLKRGLVREVVVGRRAVAAIAVCAVVICLALAKEARIYTPFSPVPYTLQTFFVYVAGAGFPPGLATLSLAAYFVLGAIGLPIFTASLFGPTTGYLLGFVAAGWLAGTLARAVERPSTLRILVAMLAGEAVILLLGAAYLAFCLGLGVPVAIEKGVVPFLAGDALKLAAALALCRGLRGRLRGLFP